MPDIDGDIDIDPSAYDKAIYDMLNRWLDRSAYANAPKERLVHLEDDDA